MKQGLSLMWFNDVFLPTIGPARPQVLIFDGHDSHHHVELIHTARENGITLIEIPSHCSHWLQPLDRTVFGSFKSHWKTAVHNYTELTACTVSHGNFFHLFRKVWTRLVADRHLLVSGFRATGIHPFNPEAIPEQAFLPSAVTSSASVADTPDCSNGTDVRLMMELILGEESEVDTAQLDGDLELDLDLDLDLDLERSEEGDILTSGCTVQDLGLSLLSNGDLVFTSPPMDLESEDECEDHPTDLQPSMQVDQVHRNEDPYHEAIHYVPPQKKSKPEFFIISSDAAFRAKVEAANIKNEKERKKAERLRTRQEKLKK